MSRYRVLCFDGGGIRGLLSVILLERLAAAVPGWLNKVQLLAGTSTGGIIALGLAHGVPLSEIRRLYEERGPAIFDDTWVDDLKDLGNLVGAEYDNRALAKELKAIFGNARLEGLEKRVLIPAFDLDNEHADPKRRRWAPKFFHNFPGPDSDGHRLARKVALYTSAAPTYFPSVDGFIDGGVVANNPSMAALAQTQDRRALKRRPALDRISLFSMGTGTVLTRIGKKRLDWGKAQWVKPLLHIMMDGDLGVSDYQCRQILGRRYHRLDPVLPSGSVIALDAAGRIPELIGIAEQADLSAAAAWLRTQWM